MNDRETLDAIAKIVDAHLHCEPAMAKIHALILERRATPEPEVDVQRAAVITAAATLREAGNDSFRYSSAVAARYCWKAEDALRAAFGLVGPDAGTSTSAPEKKEEI
jgi:hypothetical protein